MVKEVVHDPIFLGGKSELATIEDLQIARDLLGLVFPDTVIIEPEN